MFSSLNLGSLIYILDKVDKPKLKVGTIVSISQPRPYNYTNPVGLIVDIKCLVDGTTLEYNGIPSGLSLVSYNGGKVILSETKLGLLSEVENILLNSKQILENLDTYKKNIEDCENILKDLNPLFAKDKERDERLDSLEAKLDLLLTLMLK